MNDIFCTYFDHNYLSRAMLTIRSLRRFEPNTPVYVLALSELCETILREIDLPGVEIIPVGALENTYPELAAIKLTRETIEYYFTLTPFLPHYLFSHTAADRITYIDSDLYFFSSPRPTLDDLAEASVAITPHRYHFAREFERDIFGRFNVGWITYRRCPEGLDCLSRYKADCAAWCYNRVEDGRFADQKYLDAWPDRYPSLRIIEHKGFCLANWNMHNYLIRLKADAVMVDANPLVFFHFAGTRILPDGTAQVPVGPQARGGRSESILFKHVMSPYSQMLSQEELSLRKSFPVLTTAVTNINYQPAIQSQVGQ